MQSCNNTSMQPLFINQAHISHTHRNTHISPASSRASESNMQLEYKTCMKLIRAQWAKLTQPKPQALPSWWLSQQSVTQQQPQANTTEPIEKLNNPKPRLSASKRNPRRQKHEREENVTSILRPVFCTLNWTAQPAGSQSGELLATIWLEYEASGEESPES